LFWIDIQVVEDSAGHARLIVIVVNGEFRLESNVFSVRPQHPGTKPVKSLDLQLVGAVPNEPLAALPQFTRRLVRECDSKDFPRPNALFADEIGNPVRHDAGFTGARARHDEEWAVGMGNSLTLSLRETGKQSFRG
jgi:hypothetical protein